MKCWLGSVSQGHSRSPLGVRQTPDATRDETEQSGNHRKVLSNKTSKTEQIHETDEPGSFSVTGPTVTSNNTSPLFNRIRGRDFSVLTYGPYDILNHFQDAGHFPRNQRSNDCALRLLGCVFWIFKIIISQKSSWSDKRTGMKNFRWLCGIETMSSPRL